MQPATDRPRRARRRVAGVAVVQPAVALRSARLLRLLVAGCVLAVAGVACQVMTSTTLLRLRGTNQLWPVLANLCAVLACVACLLQLWVWRQAHREWSGRRDVSLLGMMLPSRLATWLALVCLAVGGWASQRIWSVTAPAEAAHWWTLAGLLCTALGVVLAAIHPLDSAGPPGVAPNRLAVRRVRLRR